MSGKSCTRTYHNLPKSRMYYRANRGQLVGNSTETMFLLKHQKNTGDDQYTYPLLDHIANELETRLVVPKDRFLAQYLIPSKLASLTPERELQVCMPFAGDLPDNNFAAYKAEMVRWKCKWQNVTEKPSTFIDTLKHAKPELYPNIHRAVTVLLTMLVTSERSFSALKRIKTYLRSTMVEDRLNGLSLMHCPSRDSPELWPGYKHFCSSENRRIQLIFPY